MTQLNARFKILKTFLKLIYQYFPLLYSCLRRFRDLNSSHFFVNNLLAKSICFVFFITFTVIFRPRSIVI